MTTTAAASTSTDRVVFTEAGERVELGSAHFVASGGEGDVYAIGARGFKLAHDPAHACPPAKLAELRRIGDPHVLAPTGALLARPGRGGPPVGHELPFVTDTWSACELVPVAFRRRHALPPTTMPALVAALRERVAAVHAAGCLVVDLSEANVLVSRDCTIPRLIDVDSFQTPSFRATAITPTIADPTRAAGDFDASTDWFSFAVLACSLLTGIHPFRGKHPRVKGLAARMKAGLSIFDPAVRLPRACLPLTSIPNPWRDWLHATLQHGQRSAPPRPGGGLTLGAATGPRALAGSLRMLERAHAPADVRAVLEAHGRLCVHAGGQVWIDGQARLDCREAVALGTTAAGGFVAAWAEAGRLHLHDLDRGAAIPCQAAAHAVTSVRGTLYATVGESVARVELVAVGGSLVAGLRPAVRIAPRASRLHAGCVVQQLLGATTVSLLSESGGAEQRRIPQLDGQRIVDAVHDRGVLVVVTRVAGEHERWVFRFRPGRGHAVRHQTGLPAHAASLVVLDTGVCVALDAYERLELFQRHPDRPELRTVDDPAVGGDWLLHPGDGSVLAGVGARVYQVSMRGHT